MKIRLEGTNIILEGTTYVGIETDMTPEMAGIILERHGNPDNRSLHMRAVNRYRDDMQNGRWESYANTITMWSDGTIADGHHRLMAIAGMDKPVKVRIVTVPKETKNLFDIGTSRTTREITGIQTYIASAIRAYIYTTRRPGSYDNTIQISASRVEAFYHENEELINDMIDVSAMRSSASTMRSGPLLAAIMAALKCGVDKEAIRNFCATFRTGVSTDERGTVPAYARITYDAMSDKSRSATTIHGKRQQYINMLIQTALSDFVKGKVRKVGYRANELKPYFSDRIIEERKNAA